MLKQFTNMNPNKECPFKIQEVEHMMRHFRVSLCAHRGRAGRMLVKS